jgi:GH43 family beta-xylosidase
MWLKEQIYGVRKEVYSKAMERGTKMENISIDNAILWMNIPFIQKNEQTFEDEYFTGTPDLLLEKTVIDIKTSWDCFTFPLFDTEISHKDYYYQLQTYMHLTGLKNAILCYILIDTPETYNNTAITYKKIESKYRYKPFEFNYDESVIKELQNRVIKAREYIEYLKKIIH